MAFLGQNRLYDGISWNSHLSMVFLGLGRLSMVFFVPLAMEVDSIRLPAPDERDWSELPVDALSVFFAKIGAIEILMGAGLVCHSWLEAAKVPDLWRSLDMTRHKVIFKKTIGVMCAMARVAVDRSAGKLESFWAQNFVTSDLLKYIGERTTSLKSIRLIAYTRVPWKELVNLAAKSPLLEDLEHSYRDSLEEFFEHLGCKCPQLRCLRVNNDGFVYDDAKYDLMDQVIGDHDDDDDEEDELEYGPWDWPSNNNGVAFAIAESMHELRILQITNNTLTNAGVLAILDSCNNVSPNDQLRARWASLRHFNLSEGCRWSNFKELRVIGEDEGQEFRPEDELSDGLSKEFCYPSKDAGMGDGWDDVYWDDISLPSDDGRDPDLSNVNCDDITQYTYLHDYYSL
ncbi:hypothetical protein OsJ_26333 [Oryza sativa Japonica Group]|uniref:F-box domain-containing protein n=2 Tax=Oryza sativa subsp. japonica TaxID=39947 RepID=B9FZH0_ORYSJ|nr:hypothetical protein OsJ_26333 [Oryza sativa Japonica Group]